MSGLGVIIARVAVSKRPDSISCVEAEKEMPMASQPPPPDEVPGDTPVDPPIPSPIDVPPGVPSDPV